MGAGSCAKLRGRGKGLTEALGQEVDLLGTGKTSTGDEVRQVIRCQNTHGFTGGVDFGFHSGWVRKPLEAFMRGMTYIEVGFNSL